MSTPVTSRPRVFLDVQIGTEPAGRIVIELFIDTTPKTCENFRALCTSSYTPPSASKPLTYKLSPFHRIIDDFMIQGGDITAGDGTGGQSIYGDEFADENVGWRNIDKEGLVCMANRGKGTNSSQFFITLAPCEHLNAKHTIFGHVVSGQSVLQKLAKLPVDKADKPHDPVLISHCGELQRPNPPHRPSAPSQQQSLPTSATPNGSNSRGRHRATRSPSSPTTSPTHRKPTLPRPQPSRSPSPFRRPKRPPPRRRSDTLVDETRRGRSLTRSQSPPSPPPSRPHHRRKRSPSRSRSRSPHLRRRHSRSRSREGWMRRREGARWRDEEEEEEEEELRREEAEREGGRGRWEGVIVGEEEGWVRNGGGGAGVGREGRAGRWGDGRLGGGERAAGGGKGEETEVRFKGRGSMKYRERRW